MKRFAAVALLLALAAAYVFAHPPANLALGRGALRSVPTTFGPWRGTEYRFDDAVVDELKADDLMIRRYGSGTAHVWLCIVYHQNRRYGAHDPLVCYQSQGYSIAREGRAHLDDGTPHGLEVNTVLAEGRRDTRVVWYWWTTQGFSTRDADAFRGRMAVLGALENRSWGAFVRVEGVVDHADLQAATANVSDFAGRVARALPAVFAAASARAPAR